MSACFYCGNNKHKKVDTIKCGNIHLDTLLHSCASNKHLRLILRHNKNKYAVQDSSYELFGVSKRMYPSVFPLDADTCLLCFGSLNLYYSEGSFAELPSWIEPHNAILHNNHILLIARSLGSSESQTKLVLFKLSDFNSPAFVHTLEGIYEFISFNKNLLCVGTLKHKLTLSNIDTASKNYIKSEQYFHIVTESETSLIVPKIGVRL